MAYQQTSVWKNNTAFTRMYKKHKHIAELDSDYVKKNGLLEEIREEYKVFREGKS